MTIDYEAIDRERYETAKREHPQYEWLLEEPVDYGPVIDVDGHAWLFEWDGEDEWDRDNREAWSWRRQVYAVTMDGRYFIGPSMGDEWAEVLDHGPIRRATEDDDLRFKYLVYPGGWKDGAPQGEPLVFSSVVDALAHAEDN